MTVLTSAVAFFAIAVNAARPLQEPTAGRDLLWDSHPNPSHPYNVPNYGCPGAVTFGTYKAYAIPQHKLLAGKIQFHNKGPNPYKIQAAGFFLHPARGGLGPVKGDLRCPQLFIPAGGALDCGFVAPAAEPLAYSSFQPFYTPVNTGSSCLCTKPLEVVLFNSGPSSASSQASATATNGAANAMADALGQAFGAAGYSQATSQASAYNGNALGLAEAICDAVFGPSSATALSNAEVKGWGNAAADAKAAAASWGSWSDAKGQAISTAWNGQALANANTITQAYGGGAFANNQAVANGKFGAAATGTGSATALGGPAITTSDAVA